MKIRFFASSALSTFFLCTIFCCLLCFVNSTEAQPPLKFKPLATNLKQPLEIKNAGDGSGRLFIAEQGGLIKIYKNGNILNKPFLDLSKTVGVGQFFGVWSIAFSPNYQNDHRFFVIYTTPKGVTNIARYLASTTNADSAIARSSVTLISFPKSVGLGHFSDMQFGNDGYLYLTLGVGANNKSAQDKGSLLGKMLRINVNVADSPYYSIPPDNPFVNDSIARGEIWNIGLRNAWRWSFDKPTGDMWLPDVGQDSIEELNYRISSQSPGSNFGWQCYEGTNTYFTNGCGNKNKYVFPIFEYHHDVPLGGECIIGGYVYHGNAYPSLQGYYICADFISTNLWEIKPNGAGGWNVYEQGGIPKGIDCFGEGEDNELYAVSWTQGTFYKVQVAATVASSEINAAIVTDKNVHSYVYPTEISNGTIILELKEPYKFVRVTDMLGREVMKTSLNNETGEKILYLPKLNPGIYTVQLIGAHMLQQKISIVK
jgi:glucose/arabinose dehydrogenase